MKSTLRNYIKDAELKSYRPYKCRMLMSTSVHHDHRADLRWARQQQKYTLVRRSNEELVPDWSYFVLAGFDDTERVSAIGMM